MSRSVWLRGVDAVVLLALIAVAVVPLAGTFGGSVMWPVVLVGLLAGGGIAALTARFPIPLTVAAVVAGYFLLGGIVAIPQTTWMGLPTLATLRRLAVGAVEVWKQTVMITPPLGASGGVLMMPLLLTLTAGAVAVSVVWRCGGWAPLAALVPVVVLVAAILFGPSWASWPIVVGLVLTLGLLTWTSWRIGLLQVRPVAAVMVVAMVGVGIGGAAMVPDRVVLRDEVTPPFDPRDYPSPLSAYRAYLKDQRETPLLTVRGLPSGAAVRLAAMDDFDGVVWNVSQGSGSGMFSRPGAAIETSTKGRSHTVEFELHALSGVWLPSVGEASSLTMDEADAQNLRYNTASATAVLMGGVRATRYTEHAVLPAVPDDARLEGATVGQVRLPEPKHVPDVVATRTAEFTGAAASAPEKARALERALVDRGWFSDGLESDYPSLSGHGADRIADLLGSSTMVGDSEQYASAMALMARQAGLPARVVLGFVPSEEDAGKKAITITGDDVQAWVEIAIAGHGWVAYYPTPPETKIPQQDEQVTPPDPQPKVLQPPPPPAAPVADPGSRDDDVNATGERQNVVQARNWLPILAVGVPVLLIVLAVAGMWILKAIRRHRRRRRGSAADRVAAGWDELLDVAKDLRIPTSQMGTRTENAAELEPVAGGGVLLLAAQADQAAFGPSEDADAEGYWRQMAAVLGVLRSGRGWWQRVRARMSLASVWRRGNIARRRTRRKS